MSKKLRLAYAVALSLMMVLMPLSGVLAQEPVVETSLDAYKRLFATKDLFTLAKKGGDDWIDINLIVEEGTDVSQWMDVPVVRKPYAGMQGVTGQVRASDLSKLATTSGVLAIRPFVTTARTDEAIPSEGQTAQLARGPKGLLDRSVLQSAAPVSRELATETGPKSYYAIDDVMGTKAAWDMGYDGQGVIVGHLDDGCDFGHPDLEGTWATVMDESSPYYGWPLIYDPGPAYLHVLGYGAFNWQAVWNETLAASYSYYVDTSATPQIMVSQSGLTATAVITNVGYTDPPAYTEVGILENTYTFSHTSQSGVYHVGIHPESYLTMLAYAGEFAAVLVVDENEAGVYDTVYVDWDANHVFDSYERFTKEHPTGWYYDEAIASWSRDLDGDGVADASAGIMYWIADGDNFVPGHDVIYYPQYLDVPGAGDLVLFYGNFDGNSHGTGTGSAVAGQGISTGTESYDGVEIPEWADVSGGTVFGSAPGAKLFSSNLFSVGTTDVDAWFMHALGYDGVPGTGDEAQVDTNSWGYIGRDDAWVHEDSRIITRFNMMFPYTTWVISSGNGGYGYGTSGPPGTSPTAIQVGGYDLNGTTQYYNQPIAGPEQILWGDLTPFSSRGPDTAGRGDVEIMGIADGATGAMPVMHVPVQTGVLDGQMAFTEFGGTSQACPFVAGVAALTAQAYKDATGMWPDYATLKELLMSSATDANNDPFVQGAGRVNAKKAAEVAAGMDSSYYVSPSQWNAGDYRGERYTDFAYLVEPGTSTSQVFTVANTGNMTTTVDISAEALTRIGQWETTLETYSANEEETRNLSKPDYLVPLYLADGSVNVIPEGTDLMVVSVSTPWDEFSTGDHTVPASMTVDSLWYMKTLQWNDLNENGVLWDDVDGNGAVNNGELDNPPSTGDDRYDNSSQEINEFNNSYQYANTKESRVELPLERAGDGLFVGLHHYTSSGRDIDKLIVPTTTLTIRADFYQHMPMQWIETDVPTLTIGAGMTNTFCSTVTIPSYAPVGLYQAKLRVVGGDQETVIPVVANVPAVVESGDLNFQIGGADPSGYLYDNSYVYGGFDWLGNGAHDQGDWRMFFVDVPDETGLPAGTQWFVETTWQSPDTDIDTVIFGPAPDTYSAKYPDDFGPYTLDILGGSQNTLYQRGDLFDWGRYAYAWQTNTGEAHETVAAPLRPGLNLIALQNVLYGGLAPSERFTGTVGTVSVEPWPITTTTSDLSGSVQLSFTASVDMSGIGYGGSYGLGKPMVYTDQPIVQGGQKLFRFDCENSALLELTLGTQDASSTPDLDLNLYRNIGGSWVNVAYSAGATSDEHIRITRPADGMYLAQVVGYTVYGTGTFDLTIRNIAGNDLTVTGLPTGTIEAGMTYTFTLNYDKTMASGVYEGIVLMGTDRAPDMMQIPVEVTFETPDMGTSTVTAQATSTWSEDLAYTITLANTGLMTGTVVVTDMLPQSDNVALLAYSLGGGEATWDPAANGGYGSLMWEAMVAPQEVVTMTFTLATTAPKMGATEVITNTVTIDDGVNPPITSVDATTIRPYQHLRLPMLMKQP